MNAIDVERRIINGRWQAGTIINTIPWTLWPKVCDLPAAVLADIALLKNASIDVDYRADTLKNDAHWIYEPDEEVPHHRLLLRSNFVDAARGHWSETNSARATPQAGWRHRNEFAYPVNTLGKPEAVARICEWAAMHGIVGAGRWGKWEHMNSDVAVAEGIAMAKTLIQGRAAR